MDKIDDLKDYYTHNIIDDFTILDNANYKAYKYGASYFLELFF